MTHRSDPKTVTYFHGPDTGQAYDLIPHECFVCRDDPGCYTIMTEQQRDEWKQAVEPLFVITEDCAFDESIDSLPWSRKIDPRILVTPTETT